MKKLAIIGSGPAGITAAISASRFAGQDVEIHLFEEKDALCKSILATGNGRCNFSNIVIDVDKYHNSNFVEEFNSHKQAGESVCEILINLGLEITTNEAGLMFPASMKASSVREVLLDALDGTNVIVHLNEEAHYEECFQGFDLGIIASGHHTFYITTDWSFYEKKLCPIRIHEDVSVADNVRSKVMLTLLRDNEAIFEECGEVQFRKYGISGIVTFNASRYAKRGDVIQLDFTEPCLIEGDKKRHFRRRFDRLWESTNPYSLVPNTFFKGFLHDNVAKLIIERLKDKNSFEELYNSITKFDLKVEGLLEDDKLFQVCRGGILVNRVNPTTLKVNFSDEWAYPCDIFACGEALDVDGPCGGYNLTWAFESGWRAGRCAANELKE